MAAFLPNPWLPPSNLRRSPSPYHLIGVTSSLWLGRRLHDGCATQLRLFLSPPSASSQGYRCEILDFWRRIGFDQLGKVSILETARDALCGVFMCRGFLFDSEGKPYQKHEVKLQSGSSRGRSFDGRTWTNVFLALNVLIYVGQVVTQGKLLFWGAKVNSLIDKGQIWRVLTSSFLHANVGHLMVNCFSLNSIGPTVEQISGPKRFIAIYICSAITSSLMSYKFATSPAVGASGAIFGLVGSFSVFLVRHRDLFGGGKKELLHVANVIALNMLCVSRLSDWFTKVSITGDIWVAC